MKKVLSIAVLTLLCAAVFAGFEVGALVTPYGFTTFTGDGVRYTSDYSFGGSIYSDYCWDNGFFAGLSVGASRTYYDNTDDFTTIATKAFGGYVFVENGDFFVDAMASFGLEFNKEDDCKKFNPDENGVSLGTTLECGWEVADNWAVLAGFTTSLTFYKDNYKTFDFFTSFGLSYAF